MDILPPEILILIFEANRGEARATLSLVSRHFNALLEPYRFRSIDVLPTNLWSLLTTIKKKPHLSNYIVDVRIIWPKELEIIRFEQDRTGTKYAKLNSNANICEHQRDCICTFGRDAGMPEEWIQKLDVWSDSYNPYCEDGNYTALAAQVILLLHLLPRLEALDLGYTFGLRPEDCEYDPALNLLLTYVTELQDQDSTKYPAALLNVKTFSLAGTHEERDRDPFECYPDNELRLYLPQLEPFMFLPNLKEIQIEKTELFDGFLQSSEEVKHKTSNVERISLSNFHFDGNSLADLLRLPRRLRYLNVYWHSFTRGAPEVEAFSPYELEKGLQPVKQTLEILHFQCDIGWEDNEDPQETYRDYDFVNGKTIGSLADFERLEHLNIHMELLVGECSKWGGLDRTLAEALPPSIKTLKLFVQWPDWPSDFEPEVVCNLLEELVNSNGVFTSLKFVEVVILDKRKAQLKPLFDKLCQVYEKKSVELILSTA